MLQGFSVPLTPTGRASLVAPPPWHYSSDCMAIEFWTDPASVTALLPPGVDADTASEGRCFLWFLDWQFTASNDEVTDPARYQYREAFILVEAAYEGRAVNYCPFIFVDNDSAIARGWAQGYPKKLASVFQTRSFRAPSAAASPLQPGSRFGASATTHGERIATARIELEEEVADPASIFNRPTVMRRYFPQLALSGRGEAPVNELTLSLVDDLHIVDVWAGKAEISLPEVFGEEMHLLAPRKIGRGYRFGMSYSVTDLKILKNYKER